jgi:hypothetical protein
MDDEQPRRRISQALNHLLERRARLDGLAIYLQEVIADAQKQLPDVIRRRDAFDIAIADYSATIDVQAIAPIIPTAPRKTYGRMTDAIRATLRRHGRPVGTHQLVDECADLLNEDVSTPERRDRFRKLMGHALRNQVAKGTVKRLYPVNECVEGFWTIAALPSFPHSSSTPT